MPNVEHTHPAYDAVKSRWSIIRDCIAGEEAIKRRGQFYLPLPNSEAERYSHYLKRAVFYNVTQRTLNGLTGQVFSRPSKVELAPGLEILEANVDGLGVAMTQQARSTLNDVLAYGRCGLLTDYPDTDGAASQQLLNDGVIRPVIAQYDPVNIINWRTTTVGAKQKLSLVVLKEHYVAEDDGFEAQYADQWRVLRLTDDGYRQEVWRDNKEAPEQAYYPTDASGNRLDEIPFTFVGPVNNNPDPDLPPLYDMAVLNVAHYRNSADYEESCFLVGQPTPYASGLTQEWVDKVFGEDIKLGSRTFIPLPEKGDAGLLQAEPNQMPLEAMQLKEKQMISIGARLVIRDTNGNIERTATEARQDEASELSILTSATKNISDAYDQCIAWASMFAGAAQNSEFELNTDFDLSALSPEERQQTMMEWQNGLLTFAEARSVLTYAGVADLPPDEARSVIENEKFPETQAQEGMAEAVRTAVPADDGSSGEAS